MTERNSHPLIRELMEKSRVIIKASVHEAYDTEDVSGVCLLASITLAFSIERFTPYSARIVGGDGDGDGGVFINGQGHGHYWVEILMDGEVWMADVTGDQFGLPMYVLKPARDAHEYRKGNQRLVDSHVIEVMESLKKASG